MKKTAILSLLLASLYGASADMTITESVESSNGQAHPLTMKIKGNKVRTDIATQISSIVDEDSGDTITIIHSRRSYMKVSGRDRELLQQAQAPQSSASAPGNAPVTYHFDATGVVKDKVKTSPPAAPERPKLVNTGNKEKVNGYNADVYTAETPTAKFAYWITTEFPNYVAVHGQLQKMEASALSRLGPTQKNLLPDTSDLKGIPLKMMIAKNGKTTTVTIVSVNEEPVPDADMAPPVGYTEVKISAPGGVVPGAGPPHPQQ